MTPFDPRASLVASSQIADIPTVLAQVTWTTVQDFKGGAGTIAGIIIIVAWVFALIAWFTAIAQKEHNPSAAKAAFGLVWLFAIGGPFVSLLFYLFVGSAGTPTPSFN